MTDEYDTTTIGIFDPAMAKFYLRYANSWGAVDSEFAFGAPSWEPLAGDWNGDGADDPAVYHASSHQMLIGRKAM